MKVKVKSIGKDGLRSTTWVDRDEVYETKPGISAGFYVKGHYCIPNHCAHIGGYGSEWEIIKDEKDESHSFLKGLWKSIKSLFNVFTIIILIFALSSSCASGKRDRVEVSVISNNGCCKYDINTDNTITYHGPNKEKITYWFAGPEGAKGIIDDIEDNCRDNHK
jgi:hypothetical protein